MPATRNRSAATLPARIDRLTSQMRADALVRWRAWAIAIADGEGIPDARELVNAAAALSIDDAAAALQDDADAIVEARGAARGEASCEQVYAEMIAPFGGDPDKILAAIEAARAEVERLQAVYRNAIDQCGASYHRSTLHSVRVKHPRVWPSYANTGKAEEL